MKFYELTPSMVIECWDWPGNHCRQNTIMSGYKELIGNFIGSFRGSEPVLHISRVATVREKYLENDIFSRSGKSQGILW